MIDPLKLAFEVRCPVERAFEVWTARIDRWWPADHTVSVDSGLTVVLEGHPGGRIFERTTAGVEHEWGWVTAWFNLVGLLTVVAAVNSGTYDFIAGAFHLPAAASSPLTKGAVVGTIILSQALFNHKGIRLTSRLIDLSGQALNGIVGADPRQTQLRRDFGDDLTGQCVIERILSPGGSKNLGLDCRPDDCA